MCLKFLVFLIVTFQPAVGLAAFPPGFRMARDPESVATSARYAQTRYNSVQTKAKDAKVKMQTQAAEAILLANDDLGLVPELSVEEIETLARIPTSGAPIPDALWNTKVGMHYRKRLAKNAVGMHVVGGSASDKLFSSPHVMIWETILFYNLGGSLARHFMAFIDYSNNRPFLANIPLPGFSYGLNLSPRWGTAIGFPNSTFWLEPFEWVRYKLDIAPLLFELDSKLDLNLNNIFILFFRYQNQVESYLRAGRFDRATRLYTQTSDVTGGLEFNIASKIILDIAGGYSFGRSIFEVKNFLDRGSNAIRIADTFVGRFGLSASF